MRKEWTDWDFGSEIEGVAGSFWEDSWFVGAWFLERDEEGSWGRKWALSLFVGFFFYIYNHGPFNPMVVFFF